MQWAYNFEQGYPGSTTPSANVPFVGGFVAPSHGQRANTPQPGLLSVPHTQVQFPMASPHNNNSHQYSGQIELSRSGETYHHNHERQSRPRSNSHSHNRHHRHHHHSRSRQRKDSTPEAHGHHEHNKLRKTQLPQQQQPLPYQSQVSVVHIQYPDPKQDFSYLQTQQQPVRQQQQQAKYDQDNQHRYQSPQPQPQTKYPQVQIQAQPDDLQRGLGKHLKKIFYSKCTGTKKALCIGINYNGQKNELKGCVNDAKNVRDFLIKQWNFKSQNIVLLTDDQSNPKLHPTKDNIMLYIRWLVQGAKAHDSLFFHYSGHGGQVRDTDGDEIDGYDEVIFPLDFQSNGIITDDTLNEKIVQPLPTGCRLTALFDSCHSGSVMDLIYEYHSDGRPKRSPVSLQAQTKKFSTSDTISFSGCDDAQTSADTYRNGLAVGAMSYAFVNSLKKKPKQTYLELLGDVRLVLNRNYSQKPQLSSSHEIDMNLQFVI